MKILTLSNLYPPDFIGGYEIQCGQVVDALHRVGHDVRVLTTAPRGPVPSVAHVERSLQLADVYDLSACRGNLRRLLAEVQSKFVHAFNTYRLLTMLESFRPDVVYLHNLEGIGGWGLLSCLQHLRVPWVWQLGDAVPRTLCSLQHLPRQLPNMDPTIPAMVGACNRQLQGAYIAVSRRVLVETQARGLRLNGPCEFLPNWVHGELPPVRTRYLENGQLRIVSAGQIGPHKGTDLIIRACARLREMGHRNFTVDLYGRITSPFWQCEIDKLGLRGCVTLRGLCMPAQLTARLADYDVFAFPTWAREPFGVAPLEAAALGCVPLMARCCGLAEWLVHGVHCLKVERSDAAYARVFADILNGRVDLAALGRRSAAVARRDFHLDAILPQIERVLARAARQPRSGAGSAAEAYHLAILAERSAQALVHELLAA